MKSMLGCTFYPTHSSDTAFRYKSNHEQRRFKSPNQKPYIFTQEIVFSNENEERVIINSKNAGISLDKLTFQKFKQQKQMLENARLPSFHIKRLIDRCNKKKKELKPPEIGKDRSPSKKQLVTQDELKKYWQSYLSNDLIHEGRTPRNFLSPLVKDKKTKPQLSRQFSDRPKMQKQPIFMNNFIRTTYRKRKENKTAFGHQLSLQERRQALKSSFQDDFMNEMTPWEEENEEESLHFHDVPLNSQ